MIQFLKANWAEGLRWLLTVALLLIVFWWLTVVNGNINAKTTKDASGVIRDPYAHAKETLAVVVPLLTLALGYWFGVKGADTAKDVAASAQGNAAKARGDAAKAQGQVSAERSKFEAVVAFAPEDAYTKARRAYPEIFGDSRP